ncbi:hypothetical protein L218DRAFT_2223 [Marasmius fiardii PR-910]|nr:hypothetical protein L218DRAFT_2223 [Marasmius fiardii PR-910]
MFLPRSLPLYLLLLLDAALHVSATASHHHTDIGDSNLFLRAVHKVHQVAAQHSKGLADDLRVALNVVLVPPQKKSIGSTLSRRDQAVLGKNVVYCKSGGSSAGSGGTEGNGTSGGGGSSSGSGSNSTIRSNPTGGTGTTRGGGPPATTSSSGPTQTTPSSPFRLVQSSAGNNFFNGWNFWTLGDPTHGIVDYVDQSTGFSNGLLEINSAGNVVMRIETTPQVSANRKSIRIQTQLELDKGLWMVDAVHMPTGCGTWPAFWTNGPNWPFDGEFDILEGVHDNTNNQATLHTDFGCNLSPTNGFEGTVVTSATCGVNGVNNAGCGIRSTSSTSYGAGFNSAGGGVYAGLIDSGGLSVWFWPRGSIPGDVSAEAPLPSSWGTPQAKWSSSGCNPDQFFRSQAAIFTNTLCGDWAGGVWSSGGCAQKTGVSTCEEYVRQNGGAFAEACKPISHSFCFAGKS